MADVVVRKLRCPHYTQHCRNTCIDGGDTPVDQLHSPDQVQVLLSTAQKHRTVHATKMNERSSRSHSVFTLRILGSNAATGESCEGCLNLVDLAGSERLKESGAQENPERLKETQSINSSKYSRGSGLVLSSRGASYVLGLSALRDVITALAEKGPSGVIPYRNSKVRFWSPGACAGLNVINSLFCSSTAHRSVEKQSEWQLQDSCKYDSLN